MQNRLVEELLWLTGESLSQIYKWLSCSTLPLRLPKSRERFSRANSELLAEMKDDFKAKTACCKLKTRPFNCELRFRATLLTSHLGDEEASRFVLVSVYEVCTSLLYFELLEDHGDSQCECLGVELNQFLDIYKTAARRVGLPIATVTMVNSFVVSDGLPISPERLREGILGIAKTKKSGANSRKIGYEKKAKAKPLIRFAAPASRINLSKWEENLNTEVTELLGKIDTYVNQHNRQFAYDKVALGRHTLLERQVPVPKNGMIFSWRLGGADARRLEIDNVRNAKEMDKLPLRSSLQDLSFGTA